MNPVTTLRGSLQRFPLVGRLLRHASWLYASKLLSSGIGLFLTLFIATRFTPAAYGAIGLVVAYCGTVGRIIDFRIWESVINYYSAYLERNEPRKALRAVQLFYAIDFGSGVLAFIVVVLSARFAARVFLDDPALSNLIVLYSAVLLVITVDGTSQAVLRSHDKFKWLGIINMIASIAKLIAFVGLLLWRPELEMIFVGYLIAGAIGSGLRNGAAFYLVRRHTRYTSESAALDRSEIKAMFRFTVGTNIFGTLQFLASQTDLLIMSFFASNTTIGLFRFSTTLIAAAMQLREPIQAAVYPEIARTLAVNDRERMRQLLRSATLLGVVILGSLCAGIIVFIGPAINLLLPDSEYVAAVPYMQIMLAGTIADFVFFWARPLLVAHKRLTFLNMLMIVRFGVWLLLVLLLVPLAGDIGWAYVYALSALFWVGSQLWYIWRHQLMVASASGEAQGTIA